MMLQQFELSFNSLLYLHIDSGLDYYTFAYSRGLQAIPAASQPFGSITKTYCISALKQLELFIAFFTYFSANF